jgi:tetratricopeptide (TPR) repeat protein
LREAEVLQNLASLYLQQLKPDEGLAFAQKALEFFEQSGYRPNVHTCLTLIGRAHRRKGDYDQALAIFQQTLQLAEASGYQPQIAFSEGEIAAVLAEQERYTEALDHYNKSYEINRTLNDRLGMAYKLMNRGDVLWRLGRYDEARDSLSQAYDLANQPDNNVKPVLAEVTLRFAEIALSQRRFAEAKTKSQQALRLADKQYEGVPVEAKSTLGLALSFSNSANEGNMKCQEALGLATHAGDAALINRAKLAAAEAELESQDAEGALWNALAAQESFARAGQLESAWRALIIAARASRLKHDESAAREQLARAADVLAQFRQRLGDEAFNAYLARPDIQFSHKQLGGDVAAANH